MKKPKIPEQIRISQLHDMPVRVKGVSPKLVKIIASHTDADMIPPITVGKVDSVAYVINGWETVLGLRASKVRKTVAAYVSDYSTIQELLTIHVKENFYPHAIDPLRIKQIIKYMEEGGTDPQTACKLLWLDKRPELLSAIRADITEEARDVLLNMIDEISKKVYVVVTPVYYVTLLSKIRKQDQYQAAQEIKSLTMLKMVSDEKSSWPSIDALSITLKSFSPGKKEVPVEQRVGEYTDIKNLKNSKIDTKSHPPNKKTIEKAKAYIDSDPDLIYVPIKGTHPDLLVHKKNGRVAIAKESNGTYAMTDDLGKFTHVLPNHVIEHFEMDDIKSVRIYKYISVEKAQKALAKAKTTQGRCVILSTVPLPKG